MTARGGDLGAARLLGDAFRLLLRHFGTLFPLAFAPALILEALNIALVPDAAAAEGQVTPGLLIATVAGVLVGYLVIALLCIATLDVITGTRRGLDACLRKALAQLLPLFVLGTILSVAAGIALVFFIVPGLYVLAQFMVWVQAAVFERAGMGALGRAQALTKGYRWPLVGALLLLGVAFGGAVALSLPLMALGDATPGRLVAALLNGAIGAGFNALIAIFTTLVYLRLRALQDGASPEEIAAAMA